MRRVLKVLVSTFAIAVAVTTLGIHRHGLFPAVLLCSAFLLGVTLLVTVVFDVRYVVAIPFIVSAAVLTRVAIFTYPATLIGNDTDGKAFWTAEIVRLGSTEGIYSSFYESAPLMYLYATAVTDVTGLTPSQSFVVFPILMGIVLPLTAVLLTRSFYPRNYRRAAIVAGAIAAVATAGMQHSYWPIAQTYAVLIWCLLLVTLIWYLKHQTWQYLLLFLVSIVSLTFSHKLPVVVVLGLLVSISGYVYLHRFYGTTTVFDRQTGHLLRPEQSLFLISGIVLFLHWGYISLYINDVIRRVGNLLAEHSASPPSSPIEPSAVEPVNPGIIGAVVSYPNSFSLVFERSHAVVLLLTAGACWLYVLVATFRRDRFDRVTASILLGGSAFGTVLTAVGVLSVGALNPNRPLMMIEPILAVLIGVTVLDVAATRSVLTRYVAPVAIGLLLVSQVFAPPAIPDYPNTPQYYLTEPEADGREFGCEYVDEPIYADSYVVQEQYIDGQFCGQYQSMDRHHPDAPLFDAGLPHPEIETVAYRPAVDVYLGTFSRWRLTWDPQQSLEHGYSNVYNNGNFTIYTNSLESGI